MSVAAIAAAGVPAARAMDLGDLMAPPSVCPDQNDADAPAAVQEQAMQCMTNFARHSAGRATFSDAVALDRSASGKSSDILRCDSFSHYACGRDFTYWMQRVGYTSARCWRAGENIAWGTGTYATVRSIFKAWLHSPGHRENILGSYGQLGVGLQVGGLEGRSGAHVWTQHFGSHCGSVRARPHMHPHVNLAGASAVG